MICWYSYDDNGMPAVVSTSQTPPTRFPRVENDDEVTTILRAGITMLTKQGGPDEMRDYLKKNNIVGRRSSGGDCVMARFFNLLLIGHDIPMHTGVSGLHVLAYSNTNRSNTSSSVELPETIGMLVAKFDRGVYPELDADIQALLQAENQKQLVNA
jgi:hypothetical protein